jgi:hypothetical protein
MLHGICEGLFEGKMDGENVLLAKTIGLQAGLYLAKDIDHGGGSARYNN